MKIKLPPSEYGYAIDSVFSKNWLTPFSFESDCIQLNVKTINVSNFETQFQTLKQNSNV